MNVRLRWISVLGAAILIAATLNSCAPHPASIDSPDSLWLGSPVQPVEPSEQAANGRTFTSSAAVLEAASTAYRRYLAVLDSVTNDGGAGTERITRLVTSQLDRTLSIAFESMKKTGMRTTGHTRLEDADLVSYAVQAGGEAVVRISACLDLTSTRAQDAAGNDITPLQRQEHARYDVALTAMPQSGEKLLVAAMWARPEEGAC